jgi:TonB-dependent receptor
MLEFLQKRLPQKMTAVRFVLLVILLQGVLLPALTAKEMTAQDVHTVKLKLEATDVKVEEIFNQIETKTEFTFVYSSKRIDLTKKISLSENLNTVGDILDFISSRTNLAFKQVNTVLMVHEEVKKSSHKDAIGAIKGRILDSLTREALPGATIFITGTTLATTSDLNGEFLIRVPAGEVTVEVRYVGFNIYKRVINVQDEQISEVVFNLQGNSTQLEGIVITGVLQGQQRALNQQKTADNIKNVVSAEQIGRFPDPNVAEALQRVPAVNIERDQGEGRYVLVRGLAPQFTNISINGEQVPSPEAGVRYVALDAVPADQLSSIEVSKALTPDMDGDAIGGSVNLITRTAQDEELSINGSALIGYNNITQKANLQGSLELSKRFFNNKLGIMLNSSYYETERGSDNWERDGGEFALRDYSLLRTRTGLSSTIDYKINDRNEIYFRTIYNRFTDREQRRQYVFIPNEDGAFGSNDIERFTKDRLEKQMVTSFNLGAKHTFQKINLDYEVAYAEAIQDTPYDVEIGSKAEVDELTTDFETNRDYPSFAVNGVSYKNRNNDYLDNSIYEFDELVIGNTYAKDVNKTAKFNIGIPYMLGANTGLFKFGGKVRMKEKSYDITENVYSWEGGDVLFPGFDAGDYTLEKFSGGTVDDNFLGNRYTLRANADPKKVIRHFNANRSGYELSVEDKLTAEALEAYRATEDVYAGYAMSRLQMDKLMILFGVRYEFTKVSYRSSEVIYDFEGEVSEINPVRGSTDYGYVLPQLHLKYKLDDLTNLRFAATQSYARPNFQDIVPSQEIDLNAREGTIGNANLKPVSASNLDFMAEHYFGTVGIISGGLFYKRMNDFIFNRTTTIDNYPGYEDIELDITQAENGDRANLFGFEIAYQQNMKFLPGFLKGLSVYANYTLTSSKAKIQSRTNDTGTEEIRLPGQARGMGNLSLAYDLKRFNIRISSNFNGEYLSEVGGDKSEDLYVKDRVQVDATAMYTITPKLRVFAEFLNITNQPFEVYQGTEAQFIQREFYSWWSRVGVKFDF